MRPPIPALALACALALPAWVPARAEEPRGCDKFAWSVERERAALTGQGLPRIASGEGRSVSPDPFTVALAPTAEARLPAPPERKARTPEPRAGYVSFAAPERGAYQVTLSAPAWIDIVQGGGTLKPTRFSGAVGCEGVRKIVRFDLRPEPFVLQLSDAPAEAVSVIVARAAD